MGSEDLVWRDAILEFSGHLERYLYSRAHHPRKLVLNKMGILHSYSDGKNMY
jgi:hypothetical protein